LTGSSRLTLVPSGGWRPWIRNPHGADDAVPLQLQDKPKHLSLLCRRDLIVCARALPARTNAARYYRTAGQNGSTCTGHTSKSVTGGAGSTRSRSAGGARHATRLSMISGRGDLPHRCVQGKRVAGQHRALMGTNGSIHRF
jgi:hypothetical protein